MGGRDVWSTDQYLNIGICNLRGGIIGFGSFPGTNPLYDGILTSVGCIPVGPNENSGHVAFITYPNPFRDELTIESRKPGIVEATLFDFTGRKIPDEDFTGNTTINTGSLSEGFYLFELVQQNMRVVKKISKE